MVFDVATGRPLVTSKMPSNTTLAMRFSPDGKTLATSGRDKTIQLWDIPAGTLRRTISENVTANGLVFLADGTLVATCGNGSIRFYNADSGQQTKLWQVGMGMGSVDVSPDGTLLAAADSNNQSPGLLKVWELSTGKEKWKLTGHAEHIRAVAFTRDGRGLVAVGGRQGATGEVTYWDLTSARMRSLFKTGPQMLGNVAVSRDNRRVVATSQNNLFLYDLETIQVERTWAGHGRTVTCGLFTANGNLITGSEDGTLKVWDAKGELLATMRGHEEAVRAVALLPNGETMLSASDDRTVKRWDLNTFKEISTLRGHTLPISSLAVGADGKSAASGAADPTNDNRGELILWDLEAAKQQLRVDGIEKSVLAVDYSPDGTRIAAGLAKGTFVVVDARTGQQQSAVAAPEIRPLAFAPDGKFVGAGSSMVTLWAPGTWNLRAALQRHQGPINSVAFSPDGGTLASASQDGTIKLCTVSPVRGNPVVAVAPRLGITVGDLEVRAVDPVVPVVQPENPIVVRKDPAQSQQQQQAPPQAAPSKPKSLAWIPIAEMIGLAITLTLVIGLGVWMRVRQGRTSKLAVDEPIIDTPYEEEDPIIDTAIEEEEPPPPITFRCFACKKGLKVKAELAGKKVRCRQCGKIVPVPAPKKDGNEQITV
jgi:WD40 repeat protein